jgi:hypothetical protein
MYKPWKPFGSVLKGPLPGISLITRGRSLTIDRCQWTNRVCISGIRIHFEQSIAGIYVVDESVEVSTNFTTLSSEFDQSDPMTRGCNVWIEEASSRIELYGDLGKINYRQLNSYCIRGQDIVLVVDAEHQPIVTEIPADFLPIWRDRPEDD